MTYNETPSTKSTRVNILHRTRGLVGVWDFGTLAGQSAIGRADSTPTFFSYETRFSNG